MLSNQVLKRKKAEVWLCELIIRKNLKTRRKEEYLNLQKEALSFLSHFTRILFC